VLQRLPAAVATLLKSTEPYIEQYFALDMPAALEKAGFQELKISACDPRHRVIACRRCPPVVNVAGVRRGRTVNPR